MKKKRFIKKVILSISSVVVFSYFIFLLNNQFKIDISNFNSEFLTIQNNTTNEYCIENKFGFLEKNIQYSWYVFADYDKDNPIIKEQYSTNNKLVLNDLDTNRLYQVKAFVKDVTTEEQRSVFVEPFYVNRNLVENDFFSDFTIDSVTIKKNNKTYQFYNNYNKENIITSFEVYRSQNDEKILWKRMEGAELSLDNLDENYNYYVDAIVEMEDDSKKINIFKLYNYELLNILKNAPMIGASEEVGQSIFNGFYKGVDIGLPLDWTLPHIEGRTLKGRIYSLRILSPLFISYYESNDEKYKERILEYIDSWLLANQNGFNEENNENWSDFSVSSRLTFFSLAKLLFEDDMSEEMLGRLQKSAKEHAELSSSEKFYKYNHNHGMYQDLSLLYYYIAYGNIDQNTDFYYQLAKTRSSQYFNYVIAKDGVHLEHSPSYHTDISYIVGWFAEFYKAYGEETDFVSSFINMEKSMKNFYYDIFMPNFEWPSIGDSNTTPLSQKHWMDDKEYKFVFSKGQEGTPPKNTFSIYPEGGYAIMRSSWLDKSNEATYILLTASTHSKAHKQQDDLNFIIYHKGEFITEGGKRNYNYMDEETKYTYSSFAHNVLLVNNEGWPLSEKNLPIIDEAAYETKITDWGEDNDVKYVSGKSVRWPTVQQERTITYNKIQEKIQVKDLLTATNQEKIQLIYHIAEGINLQKIENGWLCYRDTEPIAEIMIESSNNATLLQLEGTEEKDNYKTWIFGNTEDTRYGALLIVEMDCKEGENQVMLDINLK